MEYQNWEERYEWQRKGATLSDKTAREEFGLTQDEIYAGIDAGTLHYIHADPHDIARLMGVRTDGVSRRRR